VYHGSEGYRHVFGLSVSRSSPHGLSLEICTATVDTESEGELPDGVFCGVFCPFQAQRFSDIDGICRDGHGFFGACCMLN